MLIETQCTECDAVLKAPDTVLGKRVKCTKCGGVFVARRRGDDDADEEPTAKTRPAGAKGPEGARKSGRPGNADDQESARQLKKARRRDEHEDDDEDRHDDGPKVKGRRGKKSESSGSSALLVGLIIGGLVLVGGIGAGAYLLFFQEENKPPAPAPGPVVENKGNVPAPGTGTGGGPGAPAGGPKGGPPGSGEDTAWVSHRDEEDKFEIRFPAKPKTETQTIKLGLLMRTLKVTMCQVGAEMFIINADPVPDPNLDAETVLTLAEQQVPAHLPQGVTVTSKTPITHAGAPGRELVLTGPGGMGGGVFRILIQNERIYTLGVAGPSVKPDSSNVKKFLDSLKFE